MTEPANMTSCPSEETLAAFIDGRLEGEARSQQVEHAANCPECRSIVVAAQEFEAINPAEMNRDAAVIPIQWRRGLLPLAAAASLVAVWLVPAVRDWVRFGTSGGTAAVIESYQSLSRRTVEPRLSGGFPYKEFRQRLRGSREDESMDTETLPLIVTASKLQNEAAASSWKHLRALAQADLLLGDREGAVIAIEAARKAGGESSSGFLTDAAAVYLDRAQFRRTPEDNALALTAVERAWQESKTAENAWNRALAYELAHRDADAVRAWQTYLALDSTTPWAEEARERHLIRLQDRLASP